MKQSKLLLLITVIIMIFTTSCTTGTGTSSSGTTGENKEYVVDYQYIQAVGLQRDVAIIFLSGDEGIPQYNYSDYSECECFDGSTGPKQCASNYPPPYKFIEYMQFKNNISDINEIWSEPQIIPTCNCIYNNIQNIQCNVTVSVCDSVLSGIITKNKDEFIGILTIMASP